MILDASLDQGLGLGRAVSAKLRHYLVFGHAGAYDHEDDATYLAEDVRIIDIGDADIIHTKTKESHENIELGVQKILDAGALPVTIGGDHSINIPCINAFAKNCQEHGPIHIVQIDAHLDFVDERHGVKMGTGTRCAVQSKKTTSAE